MKRIYMAIISILCSIGIAIAISHAWFVNGYDVDPLATGSSAEAYYHSGTGTQSDPFIITTPRHLYNLAWLQYMGRYNADVKTGTNFPATYFKLGTSANGSLDMTGWPLPPIGTAKFPFIGNFNGNGWTISNLTTTNNFSEFGNKHPSGINGSNFEQENCGTIGFFGAIGAYNDSVISNTDTTTGCTYDEDNNTAFNFYLNNTNVHTNISTTIIGAVAGYVNAELAQVGVIQPHLNIQTSATSKLSTKTSNLSDFAVVGYAEEEYTTQKTKSSTIIYNPTYDYAHFNFKGMGSQADWGGSMDMQKLHARIKAVSSSSGKVTYTSGRSTYPAKEIRYDYDSTIPSLYTNGTYTWNGSSSGSTLYYKDQNAAVTNGKGYGTYLKNSSQDGTNGRFQCLTALYKDSYIINYDGDVLTGYKIHDGHNNYLTYNSSNDRFATSNDETSATIWIFENGGIFTYDLEEYSETIIRYLNATTNLTTQLSSTKSTTWSWDDTYNTFKYQNGTTWYYLVCEDGVFKTVSDLNYYIITDGTNYLVNNNGTISSTTTKNNASVWSFSNNGTNPNGVLTDIDSGKKLAINGNNLTANNSGTNWSYDGTNLFNGNKVIKFNGSNWILETQSSFLIHYGDHYLLNTLGDTQTKSDATSWVFSNTLYDINGNGSISYTSNNNTYYLNYKSSGSRLEVTQSNTTTWNHDQYGIYYNDGGTKYYIQYDSGWKASSTISQGELDGFYIHYENNYLTANGRTGTQNSTTPTTIWYVDSNNLVYTIINGTNYYLYANSDSWNIEISTSTTNDYMYKKNGKTIRYTYYSSAYYITYNNGWEESSQSQNLVWTHPIGDDYAHTPIATIGWVIDYVSRCDISINLKRIETNTHKFESKYFKLASLFNCIPINASSSNPYAPETSNTGYIMSGAYESTIRCDIRVSHFPMSNISSSWTNSAWVNNSVYTIGTDGFGKIIESGNGSGTYYPVADFSKYSNAKTQLIKTLGNSGSNVYGLHFMDASISKKKYVVADSVLINGETYTKYQMPEDCIDFNLKSKGSINCFSGYYFDGTGGTNNAFFSLHEIIRNSTDKRKIDKILHILMVYENKTDTNDNIPDGTYVYQYVNDDDSDDTGYYYYNSKTKQYVTVSSFTSSNFNLVFNSTWIENPVSYGDSSHNTTNKFYNAYKNNLFYFEIPVNEGEYALGSVSGKSGTYLCYLDIGANASVVDRTAIMQQSTTTTQDFKYVNGIQILATGSTFTSDANSCVAVIKTSNSGAINITRTNNTISFGGVSLDSTYWDEGLNVPDGTLDNSFVTKIQTTTKVLKYIDFNNGTGNLYYTTVKDVGGVQTFETRLIDNDQNQVIVTNANTTAEQQAAEFGLLKIGNGTEAGYGVIDTASNALTTYASSFSTTTKVVDYYYYVPTSVRTNSGISEAFDMNVEKVTGNETLGSFVISSGSYTFPAPDNYTSNHCYKLVGDDITYEFTQIPTGTTTTTFVVSTKDGNYTVTINGTTIAVGNYTYTFSTNTIASS